MSKRERVFVSLFFMTVLFVIYSPSILLPMEEHPETPPLIGENRAENAPPLVFWRVIDRWGTLVKEAAEPVRVISQRQHPGNSLDSYQEPQPASENPKNSQQNCFNAGCHDEMVGKEVESVHQPFANGYCETCHMLAAGHGEAGCSDCGPHKSSLADIAVCRDCHEDDSLGLSHPIGTAVDARTGDLMTCTSTCHDPHQSVNSHLLRFTNDELCLWCHLNN